jgi:hypothetical protein
MADKYPMVEAFLHRRCGEVEPTVQQALWLEDFQTYDITGPQLRTAEVRMILADIPGDPDYTLAPDKSDPRVYDTCWQMPMTEYVCTPKSDRNEDGICAEQKLTYEENVWKTLSEASIKSLLSRFPDATIERPEDTVMHMITRNVYFLIDDRPPVALETVFCNNVLILAPTCSGKSHYSKKIPALFGVDGDRLVQWPVKGAWWKWMAKSTQYELGKRHLGEILDSHHTCIAFNPNIIALRNMLIVSGSTLCEKATETVKVIWLPTPALFLRNTWSRNAVDQPSKECAVGNYTAYLQLISDLADKYGRESGALTKGAKRSAS